MLVHKGEQRGHQATPAFIPYTQERGCFGELLETGNIHRKMEPNVEEMEKRL